MLQNYITLRYVVNDYNINLVNMMKLFINHNQAHEAGHVVFFDFLGIYFFHYSEETGKLLNYGVAGASVILVFISIWRIAALSRASISDVIGWFTLVQVVQIVSFALGLVSPILVASVMDKYSLSLTYYSTPQLVIGLYVIPSLIGLSLPITIYYHLQRNVS